MVVSVELISWEVYAFDGSLTWLRSIWKLLNQIQFQISAARNSLPLKKNRNKGKEKNVPIY